MKMNPLGRTDLMVSELCLGTMTFGTHTGQDEAHRQMDMALDAGVNFLDAAEMYPVLPIAKDTIGGTEEVLGNWFERTGRRNDWIVATKVTGAGMEHVRDGAPISSETIAVAVESSLRRLKTDVIDLYQLHWPNRGSYMFRQNWTFDPSGQDRDATIQHMHDVLGAMAREVDKGRVRHFGLSNESAWGTTMWLELSKETGTPRVASLQNEYSLLCRLADTDLAEMMVNEDVSLLPFSPLGAGYLTGKYAGGAVPDGSRRSISDDMSGRETPRTHAAVAAYATIADKHGLDLTQMALAWSARRPFVASSIFGATRIGQLEHALGAADITLSDDVLAEIDEAHRTHPMPF